VAKVDARGYNGLMDNASKTPPIVNRTVPPPFTPHETRRVREWLTADEVGELLGAARKHGRNAKIRHRNGTMILLSYRHGLRPIEACTMKWTQFDFRLGSVHVKRGKGSKSGSHPLGGKELRALRRLQREQMPASPYLFVSERGAPMTPEGFYKMVVRLWKHTKIPVPPHPYMLRHATGYKLSNDGLDLRLIQEYLGHVNVQNTSRYTEVAARRFNDLWDD